MYKIDEIMEMLDCNNDIETQKRGIELAKGVKTLNVFVLPKHEGCNKNVWENCAKIIANRTDEELERCLANNLLCWVKDLSIPGALIILERLQKFTTVSILDIGIKSNVKVAKMTNDKMWLTNLAKLLDNEKIKENLSAETLEVLEQYYHN